MLRRSLDIRVDADIRRFHRQQRRQVCRQQRGAEADCGITRTGKVLASVGSLALWNVLHVQRAGVEKVAKPARRIQEWTRSNRQSRVEVTVK